MLTFFRKLRSSLVGTGQSKRYMLYAVGEILLVMIGILLALQVNNWNIARLEKRQEQNILKDLKVEFKANLKDAVRVVSGHKKITQSMHEIQTMMQDRNDNSNYLDSLVYDLFDWFTFTPKPGASNNLINAGNLNLIRNKKLRDLLTVWPGIVADLQDDELLAVNYSQDIILPFLAENYPLSNLEKFDNGISYGGSAKAYSIQMAKWLIVREKGYDLPSLLNKPIFKSHVSVKKLHAMHAVLEGESVIETCRKILELIELELLD